MSTVAAVDWRWNAIADRNAATDGRFFYGVTSTRIFCRPSCPSRRPRPERVRYFDSVHAAKAAGFRPCRRCRPHEEARDPQLAVRRVSEFLTAHADQAITLKALAAVTGMSASHLHRQFKRALGVSPREFHAARRAERFRHELRAGREVAAALYEAGYGSPSRVYEARPTGRGIPPASYRRGGKGATIGFATMPCDLGWLLVAATAQGVCAVKLGDSPAQLERELREELPQAAIAPDRLVPGDWLRQIVDGLEGRPASRALPLDIRGTAFQWRVWRALESIPIGTTRSYGEVADTIGQPTATRAVASACARNPVCVVIPCHRVVPRQNGPGAYRWGADRKVRLLDREKKGR